jgi:hypothetical protein
MRTDSIVQLRPNVWGSYIDYDAVYTVTINCEDVPIFLAPNNVELFDLDVSGNPGLKMLWAGYHRLKNLDVTKNTKLTTLMCYGNNLTSLDVSNNPDLETLCFYFNPLTSLDVSNNPKLSYVACQYNKFSADDLNRLFETLNDNEFTYSDDNSVRPKYIFIYGNPGADTCDPSIAERKGWIVSFEPLPYFDVDAWFEQKYKENKEATGHSRNLR